MRDLHQPFRQSAWLPQILQPSEQLEASSLEDIGRVVLGKAVLYRTRIDQSFVLFNKARPGFFTTRQARFHEAYVIPRVRWFPGHPQD